LIRIRHDVRVGEDVAIRVTTKPEPSRADGCGWHRGRSWGRGRHAEAAEEIAERIILAAPLPASSSRRRAGFCTTSH
jgi:hypothetical protein